MAGSHRWAGEMYNSSFILVSDTLIDASIYILDDTTVVFDRKIRPEQISLYYKGTDLANKCNVYSYFKITNFTNPVQYVSDTLKYYYEHNKITYFSLDTRLFKTTYFNIHTL